MYDGIFTYIFDVDVYGKISYGKPPLKTHGWFPGYHLANSCKKIYISLRWQYTKNTSTRWFQPSEKYQLQWESSPSRGEK